MTLARRSAPRLYIGRYAWLTAHGSVPPPALARCAGRDALAAGALLSGTDRLGCLNAGSAGEHVLTKGGDRWMEVKFSFPKCTRRSRVLLVVFT